MTTIHMSFTEGVQQARAFTYAAEWARRTIDEYMKEMKMPEGADEITRGTIEIWVHHYIRGECSFRSLVNVAKQYGVGRLFDEDRKELECDEKGAVRIWKIEGD